MVIPCGMDRGVVPLAPVVPSTHHHGSTYHCLLPQLMTLKSGSACGDQAIGDEDTPIQLIELYIK